MDGEVSFVVVVSGGLGEVEGRSVCGGANADGCVSGGGWRGCWERCGRVEGVL